jgi:hypothetical protein
MKREFNVLEVLLSRENWEPKLLLIMWEGGDSQMMEGANIEKEFIKNLKKRTNYKKRNLVFYTSNLSILLPWIINLSQKLDKEGEIPKIFIFKETAYNCKIKITEQLSLTLKNAEKFLNTTSIIAPYFYPGTKKREILEIVYTRAETKEERSAWINLEKRLKPLGIIDKEGTEGPNFFKKEIETSAVDIKREIKQATKDLLERAIFTKKSITNLNKELGAILPGWSFSYSFSAIALNIFEKRYNNYNILVKTDKKEDEGFRESYTGGRCEVFGNLYPTYEKIVHFDFKNWYGAIMQEDFPTGEFKKINKPENHDEPGFYEAEVLSEGFEIPILPNKHKEDLGETSLIWEKDANYGVIYPNGRFTGTFYSEELNLFVKNGGKITKLFKSTIFTGKKKPIFREFATKIIELRNVSDSTTWKNLLVNFYGRMAMGPKTTESIIGIEENYIEIRKKKKILKEIWIGNIFIIEIEKNEEEVVNSAVWYAAIITARGRIKLWENLEEVKKNGGRPLYCATDSIFAAFNKCREKRSMDTKTITWEEGVEDAVFAGINTYSLNKGTEWQTKIAGIPRNTINFKEFKETFYTNWEKEFKIKINKSQIFNEESKEYELSIKLNNYKKRILSLDRKTSKPWKKMNNELI